MLTVSYVIPDLSYQSVPPVALNDAPLPPARLTLPAGTPWPVGSTITLACAATATSTAARLAAVDGQPATLTVPGLGAARVRATGQAAWNPVLSTLTLTLTEMCTPAGIIDAFGSFTFG